MSEKELRQNAITEALDRTFVCIHCEHYADRRAEVDHALNCPVRDDPDLVALLRKIHEFQARWSLNVPMVDALKLVTRHIEKTVCLTNEEPGWKWVEEEK